MADLAVVREEVFALYQRQDYDRALEVAQSVADQFPANASYWIACLLAVTDRPGEALAALERALEQGAYWPPLMLAQDPDLESIRDSDRFSRIAAQSEQTWKAAFDPRPQINVYPPTAEPSGALVIALDGSPGGRLEDFASHWKAARDHGSLVVIPRSSQPHTPDGGRTWADQDRTNADLGFVYKIVISQHDVDPDNVVLAGFSQGGRVAIASALAAIPVAPRGFIAVAPAVKDHPIEEALAAAESNLRGVIFVGENDWVLESVTSLHAAATLRNLTWRLETVPDLAHDFPHDFDRHLVDALEFLL